jgi:hypothetical protein
MKYENYLLTHISYINKELFFIKKRLQNVVDTEGVNDVFFME